MGFDGGVGGFEVIMNLECYITMVIGNCHHFLVKCNSLSVRNSKTRLCLICP